MLKASALKSGDTIALIAPAGTPQVREKITRSVSYFEKQGYRVEVGKHVERVHGYLAGTDKERLSDLHAMIRNKHVKAIFMLRGGYGTIRLLQELDYDLIKRNPKIIVGYSDATTLFAAICRKTNLSSLFFGPMPGVDIWDGFDPFAEECFWKMLTSTKAVGLLPSAKNEIRPMGKLRKEKIVSRWFGGNLAVLASSVGSEFSPIKKDGILCIEEVGEEPYRVDRYLAQLRNSGYFENLKAVLLGQFTDCDIPEGKKSLTLDEVFADYFGKRKIPVLTNIPFGHIPRQWTLPLGAKLEINGTSISVIESVLR